MPRLLRDLALFSPRLAPDDDGAGPPTSEAAPAAPVSTPATTPPETTPVGDQPRTYSQDELARLLGKARDEGKKTAKDEAKRQRDEDEAKAKGAWEQLANDREAENIRLKAEIADRDRQLLAAKVAARHALPDSLAARLIGTTEAELEEDAKTLAKSIGARTAPETEAGVGTTRTSATNSARPESKKLDGPVYGFDGQPKVPWPARSGAPR
jgi:hypothetical protein